MWLYSPTNDFPDIEKINKHFNLLTQVVTKIEKQKEILLMGKNRTKSWFLVLDYSIGDL